MGLGYSVRCTTCSYRNDFFTGSGMMHYDLELCLQDFHPKTRMKIEKVISDQKVENYDFSNVLANCSHCKSLICRPWIAIHYGKDQHYETSFRCSKCRRLMSFIDPRVVDSIPCPSCHEKKLQSEGTILWD
ncbi:DNA-directed RNA polymerase subunit RPC12/RpoP [Paenibacillus sp. V4I9]|nr:DNA-directed RNA polymerase subunit RPC12/RpoP [Paenibacillus sp. V4I9]